MRNLGNEMSYHRISRAIAKFSDECKSVIPKEGGAHAETASQMLNEEL